MILQDLAAYYHRLAADPNENVAEPGFQSKEIAFSVVLKPDGSLAGIDDNRYLDGKKKRVRAFKVPREVKRSVNVTANLLWDNPAYVFGEEVVKKGKEPRDPARLADMRAAFVQRIRDAFPDPIADPGVAAVLKFLASEQVGLHQHPLWLDLLESGLNVTFRLEGGDGLICQAPAVAAALREPDGDRSATGYCLVSGRAETIARLHTAIKGVWGGSSRGGDIVSFNLPAFRSQGKDQGDNAPVGVSAEFAYTTALNHLLRKDSSQRMQVGDASTVFWAEREHPLEGMLAALLGGDEATLDNVMAVFAAPHSGRPPLLEDPTGFCVLGLAPNSARIAVRFWYHGEVCEICRNVLMHFNDLDIVRAPHEKPALSIFRLLLSLAALAKADNIPPNLAGKLYECILKGLPYPESLLPLALVRLRAEREITYARAALIKALLNRRARFYDLPEKELTVALDLENQNVGYRLGRLFAALEKVQEEANYPDKLNTTIKESYYGAASANPVVAFSRLLKLKVHHLSKLRAARPKRVGYWENIIGEIIGAIDSQAGFPAQLDLADQGRFAIGYYHQRQDFFKKRAQADDAAQDVDTQTTAVAAD